MDDKKPEPIDFDTKKANENIEKIFGKTEPSETDDITEQLKRCEVCKQQMKVLNNYELIVKFVNDLKEAKKGIGGNDTLISIKDVYKLIKKWEARSK